MNRNIITLILLATTLTISQVHGQSIISKPSYLKIETEQNIKENILNSLDTLFSQIDNEKIDTTTIDKENYKLSIEILKSLKGTEDSPKDSIKNVYKRKIINCYPFATNKYFTTIAYIGNKVNEEPTLKTIFNIVVKMVNGKTLFSIPTSYLTRTWKTKNIGNITYHFADNVNVENAKIFDNKNKTIATKFGLTPEKFDFYLCDNYQEAIRLLGYEYEMESNGSTNSGYGVSANTIFSVMHNEDFSHDLFHYYSAKIRTNKRNWYAEEGFAYCWGNAYWTTQNGKTITQSELVAKLQAYIKSHPETSLLELFDKSPKVFEYLSAEIRLPKILSSLICKEVENKNGIKGVKELLNCGSGVDNFFKSTDKLVQINRTNFDKEVLKLVENYK